MDEHQRVLQRLVSDLTARDPEVAIVAMGSVGRGDYRPGSDIDLVAVTSRWQQIPDELAWDARQVLFEGAIEARLDCFRVQNIRVDLCSQSPENYQGLVMSCPPWRWGHKRILQDPHGLAAWGEACIARFFADNPTIDQACRRFDADYRAWKRDHTYPRQFETQEAFVHSIDLGGAVFAYGPFQGRRQQW